ncbi:uncharacterized protein [Zea mays]|uniref:uncharacterized protein n=1 Tax=Zea mays TaxID=4577 RepID=UPI001652ED0A|nr:uncharacterized protein LOC118473424 [Zea mays]
MHDRDTLNYTMGEQTDDDGFQDLQSSYKRNYAAEKMNAARIREGNLLRADRVATAHKAKPREFQIENRVDNKRANASKVILLQRVSANHIDLARLEPIECKVYWNGAFTGHFNWFKRRVDCN